MDLLKPPKAKTAPVAPSTEAVPDHHEAFFELWASAAASRPTRGLNDKSIQHYRSTWTNWIAWLLTKNMDWKQVTAGDVSDFLNQLTASARARNAAHKLPVRDASPVTRRRYWRHLRDIYTHAVIWEKCEANPCVEVTGQPNSERMASMILPPRALSLLRKGVLASITDHGAGTWQDVRDAALWMLLLFTGAKTGELAAMRVDQIWTVTVQGKKQYVVNLDGERKPQHRNIVITDPEVMAVIDRWIRERKDVEFTPYWLFFGAKSTVVDGVKQRSALSHKSIFLIISQAVATHLRSTEFEGPLSHVGAETIRNSVLRSWLLDGMPEEVVMKNAGLKEPRAIARLKPITT